MDEEIQTNAWEAPEIVSHSNVRTDVEVPSPGSVCSEVADALVVLGGERPSMGKEGTGGHGRTGNVCRTCRIGDQEPTSLRGRAHQEMK